MTLIEASSGTYRSRVDGTIVLSVEISPVHRAAALALFGMPGTPMALAALKAGYAMASDAPPEPKPKSPKTAQDAALICKDGKFQAYAAAAWGYKETEAGAAELVRTFCSVPSRSELNTDEHAARHFMRLMAKYRDWSARGVQVC